MLSDEKLKKELAEGWEIKEGKIIKSFKFPSFMEAVKFVNNIANIAERLDHHPIITINWKTVKLSLKSFDVNAITERDFALAKEIDNAVTKK